MNSYKYIVIFLLIFAVEFASADVINLKNGDRITGKFKQFRDDKVTIEPDYSDEFDVEYQHIASLAASEAMEVELFDGTRGIYIIEPGEEPGKMKLVASYSTVEVAISDIKKIEEIKEIDWSSHVDFSSTYNRGNTVSQFISLQADYKLEIRQHRYLADIRSVREEEGEEEDKKVTKKQDRLNLSYNYLFKDKWFLGINVRLESDEIALLDSRRSFSPSIGYDFWNDSDKMLNIQLGAGYATEETDGKNESSSLLEWRLKYRQEFFSGNLELFHEQHMYKNIGGRENAVLNSKTGFRYDLTDDIYLNVQVDYDYDTEPAEDTEAEDIIYSIGAGLEF